MSEINCPVCGKPVNECTCGCCCCGGQDNPPSSYPLTTKNYHLLMYRANDVTSWLINYNKTMETIDSVLHSLALRTNTVDDIPQELIDSVEQLEKDVTALKVSTAELANSNANVLAQMSSVMDALTNVQTNITTLMTNVTNLETRMTSAETAIINLQTSLMAIQTSLNNFIAQYGIDKETVDGRLESLENGQTAAADAVNTLNGQVQDLGEQILEISEDIQDIGAGSKFYTLADTSDYAAAEFAGGISVSLTTGFFTTPTTVDLPVLPKYSAVSVSKGTVVTNGEVDPNYDTSGICVTASIAIDSRVWDSNDFRLRVNIPNILSQLNITTGLITNEQLGVCQVNLVEFNTLTDGFKPTINPGYKTYVAVVGACIVDNTELEEEKSIYIDGVLVSQGTTQQYCAVITFTLTFNNSLPKVGV